MCVCVCVCVPLCPNLTMYCSFVQKKYRHRNLGEGAWVCCVGINLSLSRKRLQLGWQSGGSLFLLGIFSFVLPWFVQLQECAKRKQLVEIDMTPAIVVQCSSLFEHCETIAGVLPISTSCYRLAHSTSPEVCSGMRSSWRKGAKTSSLEFRTCHMLCVKIQSLFAVI